MRGFVQAHLIGVRRGLDGHVCYLAPTHSGRCWERETYPDLPFLAFWEKKTQGKPQKGEDCYPRARNQYINNSPGIFSCIRAGASTGATCIRTELNSFKNLAILQKMIPQKYFPVFAQVRIQAPHVFERKLIPPEFFPACIGFVPGGISCWAPKILGKEGRNGPLSQGDLKSKQCPAEGVRRILSGGVSRHGLLDTA